MTEGKMRMLGNFVVRVYENALGTCLVGHWREGPYVKIVGPQSDSPCIHHLSSAEAREVAAELIKVADEVDMWSPHEEIAMPCVRCALLRECPDHCSCEYCTWLRHALAGHDTCPGCGRCRDCGGQHHITCPHR